jgi:hypothetical protein
MPNWQERNPFELTQPQIPGSRKDDESRPWYVFWQCLVVYNLDEITSITDNGTFLPQVWPPRGESRARLISAHRQASEERS